MSAEKVHWSYFIKCDKTPLALSIAQSPAWWNLITLHALFKWEELYSSIEELKVIESYRNLIRLTKLFTISSSHFPKGALTQLLAYKFLLQETVGQCC